MALDKFYREVLENIFLNDTIVELRKSDIVSFGQSVVNKAIIDKATSFPIPNYGGLFLQNVSRKYLLGTVELNFMQAAYLYACIGESCDRYDMLELECEVDRATLNKLISTYNLIPNNTVERLLYSWCDGLLCKGFYVLNEYCKECGTTLIKELYTNGLGMVLSNYAMYVVESNDVDFRSPCVRLMSEHYDYIDFNDLKIDDKPLRNLTEQECLDFICQNANLKDIGSLPISERMEELTGTAAPIVVHVLGLGGIEEDVFDGNDGTVDWLRLIVIYIATNRDINYWN